MPKTVCFASGPSSIIDNATLPKRDIGDGIMLQIIGEGENLNAIHWNIPDGGLVPRHNHPQEQFGYVIRGALQMKVEGVGEYLVKEGDSYIIPPNLFHEFVAVGQTEAIDVFSPLRDLSTVGGRPATPNT